MRPDCRERRWCSPGRRGRFRGWRSSTPFAVPAAHAAGHFSVCLDGDPHGLLSFNLRGVWSTPFEQDSPYERVECGELSPAFPCRSRRGSQRASESRSGRRFFAQAVDPELPARRCRDPRGEMIESLPELTRFGEYAGAYSLKVSAEGSTPWSLRSAGPRGPTTRPRRTSSRSLSRCSSTTCAPSSSGSRPARTAAASLNSGTFRRSWAI